VEHRLVGTVSVGLSTSLVEWNRVVGAVLGALLGPEGMGESLDLWPAGWSVRRTACNG